MKAVSSRLTVGTDKTLAASAVDACCAVPRERVASNKMAEASVLSGTLIEKSSLTLAAAIVSDMAVGRTPSVTAMRKMSSFCAASS